MEAKKRNQKMILVGLLMGLLAVNTPWEQYLSVKWDKASDLASMTDTARNKCAAGIEDMRAGRINTENARMARQADQILTSNEYRFSYGPEDEVQLHGVVRRSSNSVAAPGVCPGNQAFCDPSERVAGGEPQTILSFNVVLSTDERTTTEADNGIICRECNRGLDEFDFEVSTRLDRDKQVEEVCTQFQVKRSNAYYDLQENNELLSVAQKEAKISEVADRLEELQKECKANKDLRASDRDVDGGDMAELLEEFGWDEEEAIKQLNILADIDVEGEGIEDEDVHEMVEELAITSRREFVSCHKGHMSGLSDDEEDEYFHDHLLDHYREWMVSDDEDAREYAFASLDTWQDHSGFTRKFRRFLRTTEYRGKRTNAFDDQLAEINRDYERLRARYSGDPAALRNLEQIYDGVRATAEQGYRIDMHNSLAGLPTESDILTSAMDFWSGHADGISTEADIDDSFLSDLDFDSLARTQIENPQRFSRWQFSRGNDVSERIEDIMSGALRDSNRMLDRFQDRRRDGGTSLDRFRLDSQFADGGRYPRYNAPPSTRTRNSFL
ncbi:MAG: hypothetical protein HRT45_17685 [Bdellovibrionales bacterium]|nr:hypothetical protein [Bdellovibrionales bacterium]